MRNNDLYVLADSLQGSGNLTPVLHLLLFVSEFAPDNVYRSSFLAAEESLGFPVCKVCPCCPLFPLYALCLLNPWNLLQLLP